MTSTYASIALPARLVEPARLKRLARAVLFALLVAFAVTVLAASGSSTVSGRLGGDYPAFYGAGRIVADGDADALYEPARQEQVQQHLFGDEHVGYLHFAYPPFVAALYAPLAQLPYGLSYALHTMLMLGAVVLALHLLRPVLRVVDHHFELCLAATIAFFPMFRAVTAGQNTAVTLLLVAWAWRALHDHRHGQAGVALGLLLFKPQLALMLLALNALHRRWRTVGAAAATGAGLWLAGALVQGPGWVGPWWHQASRFGELDAVVNGANAVSWLGAAQAVLGADSAVAAAVGWGLALLTVAVVAGIWIATDPNRLTVPMAAAVGATVLASPHTMFYDAGLLALVGLAVGPLVGARTRRLLVGLWAIAALHGLNELLGVTPLFLVTVGGLVATLAARDPVDPPRPAPLPDKGPRRPLSIVIPAYNEALRIGPTLMSVAAHFAGEDVEVVVVDDGSTDDTAAVVFGYESVLPGLRVIRLPENRGKGHAVRAGMLAATGEWRLMMDADGSTDVSEIGALQGAASSGAPVAIGSIAVPGADVVPQSFARRNAGRVANLLIRGMVLPGIHDSQRGFKLFRGDVADDVFSRARVDGWGFDVEVLALARTLGHRVAEVGVRWEHREDSRVKAGSYLTTLRELLAVRRAVGCPGPAVPATAIGSPQLAPA